MFHHTVPSLKVRSLSSVGRTKAVRVKASRKSLHLCSPPRRGMKACLGNKKPKRAIVRRIHAGRFRLWRLMNCKRNRSNMISIHIFQTAPKRDSEVTVRALMSPVVNCDEPWELKPYRTGCFHNRSERLDNTSSTRTRKVRPFAFRTCHL